MKHILDESSRSQMTLNRFKAYLNCTPPLHIQVETKNVMVEPWSLKVYGELVLRTGWIGHSTNELGSKPLIS